MKSPANFIGRVGILAATLGVGAVFGGFGLANADAGPGGSDGPTASASDSSSTASSSSPRRTGTQRSTGAGRGTDNPASGSRGARSAAATAPPAVTRNDSPATSAPTAVGVTVNAAPKVSSAPAPAAAVAPAAAPAVAPAASSVAATAKPVAATPAPALPKLLAAVTAALTSPATPVPAVASAPVQAAAPLRWITGLLAPLLGSGAGFPGESPASWLVLAAARRPVRTVAGRTAAATLTTGQAPAAAATTGTTTTITWNYGANPVVNFNPATDKLDFGWMQAAQFDVSDSTGSTQITVVGNNQTYTLKNVTVGQLSMTNIVAKDSGTVSKWQGLITAGQNASPIVSIANATVAEGNSGTANAVFNVSLSKSSTKTITVAYSTANGTATAGQDYTAASGTLTFAPGVTTQQVNVKVAGDTAVEPDETFTVNLASPTNATVGAATATGTITNDDVVVTPPAISIANASVAEGNSGTSNLTFNVSLSKAATSAVTVAYSTANGTATAGQDYTAASGTLTFAAGTTTQQITVKVAGDTTVEPSETVTVTLTNPTGGATLGTATATGTITDDDTPTSPDRFGKTFFAPYVDMGGWPVPNLLQISQATGATLVTAAFLQADPDGKAAWAGISTLAPDATGEQAAAINKSIADFKAAGGDVMVSFGGAAGTSLAQYYSAHGLSAQALADAYTGVINKYGITHIDFDVEGAAVADPASNTLNGQALKLLQQAKPEVQVWFTLPVLPTGLTADGLKVVDAALSAGVKIAGVNVMAMDYGDSAAPPTAHTMGYYAIQSAQSTYSQLSTLFSSKGQTFGWNQVGVTPMIGVNDVQSEVFTVADAQALEDFARSKGIGMLGFWSVTRDTPGSLGIASPTASGLSDPAGSFSKVFNDYGTINTMNYGSAGGGGSSGGGTVTGGTTTKLAWNYGANTVLTFNPAKDVLDFGWMQPANFTIGEQSGSTIITIVNNNQTYKLNGVPLRALQIGNISALDASTTAAWQAAINAAKAA